MTLYDVSNTMTSPSLHVTGTSLAPMLDLSSQHAEGNESGVVFMVNNNSVCKSETPEPPSDSPPCVSFPAVAVAKTQDYPCPQLIPEGKTDALPVFTSEICWNEDMSFPDCTGAHAVMTVT